MYGIILAFGHSGGLGDTHIRQMRVGGPNGKVAEFQLRENAEQFARAEVPKTGAYAWWIVELVRT